MNTPYIRCLVKHVSTRQAVITYSTCFHTPVNIPTLASVYKLECCFLTNFNAVISKKHVFTFNIKY
jgi:hypothetical protein